MPYVVQYQKEPMLEDLNLCPIESRETAPDAPPFNPSKPIKKWRLKPPTMGNFNYITHVKNASGNPPVAIIQHSIPAADADKLNLPGPIYPAYQLAPSFLRADYDPWNTTEVPTYTPADRLSTHAQAWGLINLFTKMGVVMDRQTIWDESFGRTGENGETRRQWSIRTAAATEPWQRMNVGQLLWQMNGNGIGAPGRFVPKPDHPEVYIWESVKLWPAASHPELPCPQRALRPDEEIVSTGGLMQGELVVRKKTVDPDMMLGDHASEIADLKRRVAALEAK
jgi:hypothetical protein